MRVYYRISNNSYKKNRIINATKIKCLLNFLSEFKVTENFITIVADNVTDVELREFVEGLECDNIKVLKTSLGNTGAFSYCLNMACQDSKENDFVYFAEDDYFYLPGSFEYLKEGLEISDYVTLYDHPDKYLDAVYGGNPQIENGGEVTRVVVTKTIHWKLTNSTTGTFGVQAKSMREDKQIWEKYVAGSYLRDYEAFCELIGIHGRSLISCIPGKSTHSEVPWLSPLFDWNTL